MFFSTNEISANSQDKICLDCVEDNNNNYVIEYEKNGDIKKLEIIVMDNHNSTLLETRSGKQGIITKVITIVAGACKAQNYGGFNPCTEFIKIVHRESGTKKA